MSRVIERSSFNCSGYSKRRYFFAKTYSIYNLTGYDKRILCFKPGNDVNEIKVKVHDNCLSVSLMIKKSVNQWRHHHNAEYFNQTKMVGIRIVLMICVVEIRTYKSKNKEVKPPPFGEAECITVNIQTVIITTHPYILWVCCFCIFFVFIHFLLIYLFINRI